MLAANTRWLVAIKTCYIVQHIGLIWNRCDLTATNQWFIAFGFNDSPAGKGLTSWLSFVVSILLVYHCPIGFLIFAPYLYLLCVSVRQNPLDTPAHFSTGRHNKDKKGLLSNLLKKTRFGIASLRENGILKTDTKEKANICYRQF